MDDGRVSLFVLLDVGGGVKCSHGAISDTEAEGREGSVKVPSHTHAVSPRPIFPGEMCSVCLHY